MTEPPSASKANPAVVPSAPTPKPAPRVWTAVPTTQEVEVRHDAPRSLAEAMVAKPREVEARFTQVASEREVVVVRDGQVVVPQEPPSFDHLSPAQAAVARLKPQVQAQEATHPNPAPSPTPVRGTGPLANAPAPGAQAQGGWFRKLFTGH